jgi:hypothetical protein
VTSFEWQGITAVMAFKRDCVIHDLVCLAVADINHVVEVDEQDTGWDDFIVAVEKKALTQPPFGDE